VVHDFFNKCLVGQSVQGVDRGLQVLEQAFEDLAQVVDREGLSVKICRLVKELLEKFD